MQYARLGSPLPRHLFFWSEHEPDGAAVVVVVGALLVAVEEAEAVLAGAEEVRDSSEPRPTLP